MALLTRILTLSREERLLSGQLIILLRGHLLHDRMISSKIIDSCRLDVRTNPGLGTTECRVVSNLSLFLCFISSRDDIRSRLLCILTQDDANRGITFHKLLLKFQGEIFMLLIIILRALTMVVLINTSWWNTVVSSRLFD